MNASAHSQGACEWEVGSHCLPQKSWRHVSWGEAYNQSITSQEWSNGDYDGDETSAEHVPPLGKCCSPSMTIPSLFPNHCILLPMSHHTSVVMVPHAFVERRGAAAPLIMRCGTFWLIRSNGGNHTVFPVTDVVTMVITYFPTKAMNGIVNMFYFFSLCPFLFQIPLKIPWLIALIYSLCCIQIYSVYSTWSLYHL